MLTYSHNKKSNLFVLAVFILLCLFFAVYQLSKTSVTILSVDENSLAEKVGLQAGDAILIVNNQEVEHSREVVAKILDESGDITLVAERQGKKMQFVVDRENNEALGIGIYDESVLRKIRLYFCFYLGICINVIK